MISEIHNMDCMKLMRQYPDKHFDLAVVDPPYGIEINMNMGRRKGQRKKHKDKSWDNEIPQKEYFDELMRVSKNQIVWGGNYFPLPLTKSWIFWDKEVPAGVSFADGELAWTSFDKTLVKARIKYTGFQGMDIDCRIHPTQKPVALYDWIFKNYAKEGQLILDTHIGSGSSRIAADRAGLNFVGCELDADYFASHEKRWNEYKLQMKLL